MAGAIPRWRLREICNIADFISFRGTFCAVGGPAMVLENQLLRADAHIRMVMNPALSNKEIRLTEDARKLWDGKPYASDIREERIETVEFNCDPLDMDDWEALCRRLLRELAKLAFFSASAAKKVLLMTPGEQEAFLNQFCDKMIKQRGTYFATSRPRFTLARLREIARKGLNKGAWEAFGEDIQSFLTHYLGSEGW